MINRCKICALKSEIMRLFLIVVVLLFVIHNAVGQDVWVRPLAFGPGVDTTTIMVLTYDTANNKRWIPGTNISKPNDCKNVTDTSFYLLPNGAYLPTTQEKMGDMLYDNELLPFDRVVMNTFKVANFEDKKKLTEVPPLNVELVYQRTSYQFKDTIETALEYQKFRDSVIGVRDTMYMIVKSDNLATKDTKIRLLLVVNNKDVLFDDSIAVGNPILLDTAIMIQKLELSKFVSDLKEPLPSAMPVPRIMVSAKGRTISFIKGIHTEKTIDKTTKIPKLFPKNEKNYLWLWIFIGAFVLLGVLATFLLIKKPEFLFKKKESRKFDFDFKQIDDENNVEKVINKLRELAHQDDSLNFIEVEGKKHRFSFYINQNNANRFVIESSKDSVGDNSKVASQASDYYQTLFNYIEGLYADHPDRPKVKRAKKTLAAIDVLVAKLSKIEQVQKTSKTDDQNLDQGKSNEALLNEVLKLRKELKDLQKYMIPKRMLQKQYSTMKLKRETLS